MAIITVIILIFIIPYIWVTWSGIDVRNGKREKIAWKKPCILLLFLVLVSGVINLYFYSSYHLPIFPNLFENMVGLIVTGAFLLILSIINIIVSIMYKGAPKSFHNPKTVWIFTGVLCLTFLFSFSWIFPFAQKVSYVAQINAAMQELSQAETEEEVTVLFMSSEKNCVRRRNSNCVDVDYDNRFFVKNNLDEKKQIQVRIRALDSNQKELKVVDSEIMTLDAGELRLVETEETYDDSSIWSKYSFQTEVRTNYYESLFRFRDVE